MLKPSTYTDNISAIIIQLFTSFHWLQTELLHPFLFIIVGLLPHESGSKGHPEANKYSINII